MAHPTLDIPQQTLHAFCEHWQVTELSLFGSAVREDFRANSDVDVLIDFHDGATPTLFDLVQMAEELEIIFERPVDLVTRRSVERSANYLRRDTVLNAAEVIYAAG